MPRLKVLQDFLEGHTRAQEAHRTYVAYLKGTILKVKNIGSEPAVLRSSAGTNELKPGGEVMLSAYDVFEILGNPHFADDLRDYQGKICRQVYGWIDHIDAYDMEYTRRLRSLGYDAEPPRLGGRIPQIEVTFPDGAPVEESWPIYDVSPPRRIADRPVEKEVLPVEAPPSPPEREPSILERIRR